MSRRVVILGGGFAGLFAARRLSIAGGDVRVTLVDPREASEFLPMLPDLIGRALDPTTLQYPLADARSRWNFRHVRDAATGLDFNARRVHLSGGGRLGYDYLLIATGTRTNFYGQDELARRCLKLDSVADGVAIHRLVADAARAPETLVVVGGGYTGVEVATNFWRALDRQHTRRRIVLVDLADKLCANVAEEFADYVAGVVADLDIEVHLEDTVETIDAGRVTLRSGQTLTGAKVVWSAGVTAPEFIHALDLLQTRQGRLEVDEFLRARGDNVFAAGDAAAFRKDGDLLRMSVQFSISEGWRAGENILRSIGRKPLKAFRPVDLGYVVPMANFRGAGRILGRAFTGRIPALMHYVMCECRTWGLANRAKLLASLLRRRWA